MTSMDKKRKVLELERVKMARLELEFKIEERQEEILRLQEMAVKQIEKEKEISAELAQV